MPITNPHATEAAKVERHAYAGGRPFWLALCHGCGLVLNSGHHYATEEAAQAEADRHNAQVAELVGIDLDPVTVGLVGLRRRAAELDTIRGEVRAARSTLRAANLGLDGATAGTEPGIAPADVEVRYLIGQALDLLRTAGEVLAANITSTNRTIYALANTEDAPGRPICPTCAGELDGTDLMGCCRAAIEATDRARTLARFTAAEAAGEAELGLLPR